MINLSEAEVKKGVEDYLQYAANQGKLMFNRLNAGDFIEVRGGSRRRIKGAEAGTADFVVYQAGEVHLEYMGKQKGPVVPVVFVTYIECKSSKGKQAPVQLEFEKKASKFNCRYAIVRGVDELMEVLKRE
ncbi:MAG: hypothetical protein E3J60_01155 [Dehalococcoidia bacterium]|nr:MAG: hypothetical protein E3J60_01155 [Dehalococcoidia bacterium]